MARGSIARGGTIPLMAGALIAVSGLAACTSPNGPADPALRANGGQPLPLLFARAEEPNGYMEALFTGRVLADAAGCLRLDGTGATVIWPRGYHLRPTPTGAEIVNGRGEMAGAVGGSFRLGGGEVTSLEHVALAPADAERAAASCPGRYWIASGS